MSIAVDRQPELDLQQDAAGGPARVVVHVLGDWLVASGHTGERAVDDIAVPAGAAVTLDCNAIGALDTSGAWLLHRLMTRLADAGHAVALAGLSKPRRDLLREVGHCKPEPFAAPGHGITLTGMLETVGRITMGVLADAAAVTNVLGAFVLSLAGLLIGRTRLRVASVVSNLDRVGLGAVPIMVLMSFLIGGIIAQQGAYYLRTYGADLYVVDLVGVLVLRELGVLLTSIMVAGRSGSAFTAEIGSMKMREEIDAMKVIGVDPIDALIVPRLLALMIAVPVLTFISDMAALAGAGALMWAYMGIPPDAFIVQLQVAVDIPTLMIGLYKAPIMALIIGLIACVEGMKVGGSAESLGRQTTSSVVKAIFMVIFVDGIYAVFFAGLGM
ncbi:ABC transporter permease [Pseudoxanthobacter sp.]|uniref:ABC transporter permease n=1 Tax=Pseudoxanthobacter sp. TaxID=1925742 RepID=UPI002FE334AC